MESEGALLFNTDDEQVEGRKDERTVGTFNMLCWKRAYDVGWQVHTSEQESEESPAPRARAGICTGCTIMGEGGFEI
jgi:hypothetical protein